MDFNSLLIQVRSQVTPKWKELGSVVGISKELLDKYSSYPPEECIVEVLDYWLRSHSATGAVRLTWRDVGDTLMKIGLHQLAESIMSVYQTGKKQCM